jgi:membrane protease subunit (stomatin/prohibitin family)
MITWTKRLLLTVSFLALITTNILAFTSTAFNAAVSGVMGTALGVRTVSGMMQSKISSQNKSIKKQATVQAKHKAATRKFGARLASRTKRVAAKSIAAIPAESIPLVGIAVLIADTSYELYAACETVRDMDQLYKELGIEDETPNDAMHSVCDPQLPDAADVWSAVLEKMNQQ